MCVCINISGSTSVATVPLRPRRRKDIEMKTFWLTAAFLAICFAEDIVQDKEDLKELHNKVEGNIELLRTGTEGEASARASSSYQDYNNYDSNINSRQSLPNYNNWPNYQIPSPGGNQNAFSQVPNFGSFPSQGNQNLWSNFPNQEQINHYIPQGSTFGNYNPSNYFPPSNNFPSGFNYNLSPQSDVPVATAPVSNDPPANQDKWQQNGNQQWIQPVNNNPAANQNYWQQQNNNQQSGQPATPVSSDPAAVQNDWQQPSTAAPVGIIKDERVTGDNGYYRYEYQYTDGTHVSEEGFRKVANDPNTTVKRGFYRYTAADGKVYTTTYWADENGYTAYGDHLPKAPPVPAAIQEALDKAAKEEVEKNQHAQRPQQDYPVQEPQQNYPAQQPQQSYPSQQPQQNYPAQQTQLSYPAQQTQQSYPAQQTQQSYPAQQTQSSYPAQQTQQSYPAQQPQQSYPAQQPEQTYPTQQPQQSYPAQQPQQTYPAQLPQQNYLGQQPQQSYPTQHTQNNYPQQYGK